MHLPEFIETFGDAINARLVITGRRSVLFSLTLGGLSILRTIAGCSQGRREGGRAGRRVCGGDWG